LAAAAEPAEPTPGVEARTETVAILAAQKSGDLAVSVRGQGEDRVKFALHNNSTNRLNVVLPPGLVAASMTGQLQSMGLGSTTNTGNSFGGFQPTASETSLRSVPPASPASESVAVPAGKTVEFTIPSVCLNFGLPTPTPHDTFKLMDVDDYSTDPRVRKALRTLATVGTSHGVAQATMWKLCNNVPFPVMTAQFDRLINANEAALASRFIEALDASGSSDLVDPAYLNQGRVFVHVGADGALYKDAKRLSGQLDGLHILGLPVRTVGENEAPTASAPAVILNITLAAGRTGETKGRIAVRSAVGDGNWTPLGQALFTEGSEAADLDGPALARALDHAMATAFVSVRPAKRTLGSTTLRIENRLPFTLSTVVVKAGNSAGAPSVSLKRLGVGPARFGLAPIQAASAAVERVEVNGL